MEIGGCGHIFCCKCLEDLATCPTCCGPIDRISKPNNAILRMLMRVRGSCSTCAWTGTYKEFKENHDVCWTPGEETAPSSDEKADALPIQTMQDYYLEATPANSREYDVRPSSSVADICDTLRLHSPNAELCRGKVAYNYVPNSMISDALTVEQRRLWRQSINCTAKDYGLSEGEYNSLIEHFTDFASMSMSGAGVPELRWRDACRLLRYYNYPNHPDDVQNLFDTAHRSPKTQSIPFHALCLWLPLNRRNPSQWYSMPNEPYSQLLLVAQLLDVEKTGLFTLDQCKLLAEQYFERDIASAEWNTIVALLKEKDVSIRLSFVRSPSRHQVAVADAQSAVKLPFHDALCSFASHVETLKKQEHEASLKGRNLDIIRRIQNMVRYYEPPALATLDKTLQSFKGEEDSLLMTLTAMYGPEPPV